MDPYNLHGYLLKIFVCTQISCMILCLILKMGEALMKRTNIVLDDKLVEKCLKATYLSCTMIRIFRPLRITVV